MIPFKYILGGLQRRKLRTVMTVIGIAMVIAIYAVMNAISAVMVSGFQATGAPDEVVVQQAGAMMAEFSNIDREAIAYVRTLPGVLSRDNQPLVSPELQLTTVLQRDGAERDVNLRGVTDLAADVYTQVSLKQGQWPATGYQATVGVALANKLKLDVGSELVIENASWTVAGILDSSGRIYDQEIWVHLDDLTAQTNRTKYSSFLIKTSSPEAAAALTEEVNSARRYPISAMRADTFFALQGQMAGGIADIGSFLATIIVFGAVFGGMNTMYSTVAGRRREIGMLRAIGFRPRVILGAVVLESVMLALIAGAIGLVLGAFIALVPMNVPYVAAAHVSLGWNEITGALVMSTLIGVFGGLLPAIQAARLRIVNALSS
jgi:putative ABC transport system permease protein